MLSFVLGAPKSGKTESIIKSINKDLTEKKRVLFIVPEQEALSAERKLIAANNSGAEFFLLEIANFSRLSNIVFREKGGICYNYIDNGGKALMMWRALNELSPSLNSYKAGESTDIGLISDLTALYSQLADYRVSPLYFEDKIPMLPETLRPKAEDIAIIYHRYDELIHNGFDSEKDDLLKVADMIRNEKMFSCEKVYIDSFSGFTPAELDVIKALIAAGADVTVSLCIDPVRDSELFSNLYDIKNMLTGFAQELGVEVVNEICRAPSLNCEFEHISKYIFDSETKVQYPEATDSITLTEAPDIYTECELICADIASLIKKGMRYRDITVVTGDTEAYRGILDVMMQRHDMPCRFSAPRDVSQSLCVKFIISALNIITYNWRLCDVITYLKTGLCGITDEECDIIEEYASTWSLSGYVWTMDESWSMNPAGYTSGMSDESIELLERINILRDRITQPVTDLADKLKTNRDASSAAQAIYRFLTDCIDPNALKGEDIASWNAVITALEQLSICGAQTRIENTETLKRLIRLISSQISFSMLPASIDEINIVNISSLRSVEAKRIYIIGANEGCYPCDYKENSILDDRMRAALTEGGLVLPHDPEELYCEQNWLFYKTLLSASESVWISRPSSSLDGVERIISPCLAELKRIFPLLTTRSYSDYSVYELIYDKVSAFDRISDESFGEALRDILSGDKDYRDAISSYSEPVYTEKCAITLPENLEHLKGDMPMSQTKLESFVKCKFAYQLEYNLRLNEQMKVNYDARDIGNFIHKILEDYLKESMGKILDDKEKKSLVDNIVDRYINDTCASMTFVSKRMLFLFEKLRRNAHLFVRSISKELEDSDFKPMFFEMSVNTRSNADLPPVRIELSDGSFVYINGQIDRVDAFEKNGKVYFRIIDYKTGKKEFSLRDLGKGVNLQMFLYLFAIIENKEKFLELLNCTGELVPCATLYYLARLNTSTHDIPKTRQELEDDVIGRIERKGALLDDEEVFDAMSHSRDMIVFPVKTDLGKKKGQFFTLESIHDIEKTINEVVKNIAEAIKRGEADAMPDEELAPCIYCRMKNVCRNTQKGDENDE